MTCGNTLRACWGEIQQALYLWLRSHRIQCLALVRLMYWIVWTRSVLGVTRLLQVSRADEPLMPDEPASLADLLRDLLVAPVRADRQDLLAPWHPAGLGGHECVIRLCVVSPVLLS